MKTRFRFLSVVILGAGLLAVAPGLPAAVPADRPASVEGTLEEVIPQSLKAMLLTEPYVRFLVTVSAEGEVVDYVATHATHYGLLERAEKRLLRGKFLPAISAGVPVQASGEFFVTFFDPEQRAFHSGLISLPSGNSSMDAAVRWMSEAGRESLQYSASQPDELDAPLEMAGSKVLVLTDEEGHPAVGGCVVEFYINDRGEVRLPRIVSSDSEAVSKSALLTILETKFQPLTRNGKPTYVKVRQPMEFQTSKSESAGG